MNPSAILILAHGSKVEKTNETMEQYMDALKKYSGEVLLEKAYLQLMEPSMETAIETLYQNGVRQLTIFPFFLFQGNHILEDIPSVIESEKLKYPDLSIQFLSNIGFDETIVKLIATRVGLI